MLKDKQDELEIVEIEDEERSSGFDIKTLLALLLMASGSFLQNPEFTPFILLALSSLAYKSNAIALSLLAYKSNAIALSLLAYKSNAIALHERDSNTYDDLFNRSLEILSEEGDKKFVEKIHKEVPVVFLIDSYGISIHQSLTKEFYDKI